MKKSPLFTGFKKKLNSETIGPFKGKALSPIIMRDTLDECLHFDV